MPWDRTYWGVGVWGAGFWNLTATPAQIEQVRRFIRTFRAAHDTPMWLRLKFASDLVWGVGAWGVGFWGGSNTVALLIGEPHWTQRGYL